MSLRAQVKQAFDEADSGKTGKISTKQLEDVLKKLNGSITADEISTIMKKLDTADGNVNIDNFLDIFCSDGGPPGLRKELSRTTKPEELAVIKEAFKKFDKDGSNSICIKELQAMCAEMGKKLNDSQAQAAMRQLDKNGDASVDFDEFLLWWQCTPGMGGYDHVALGFLKAKLSLKSRAKAAFSKVQRKKIENPNEFVWRGSIDITPNFLNDKAGSDEKSAVSVKVVKVDAPKPGGPAATITFRCASADDAATLVSGYDKLVDLIKKEEGEEGMQFAPKAQQVGDALQFTMTMPPEAVEEMDSEMKEIMGVLQEAIKKVEIKVTSGTSFEDMVKDPLKPVPLHFRGYKLSGEVLIGLESLAAMAMKDDAPPFVGPIIKLMAGLMTEAKIGFDETSPLMIISRIKKMSEGGYEYMDPPSKLMFDCVDKGLENFRNRLYKCASTDMGDDGFGMIKDGEWTGDIKENAAARASAAFAMDFIRLGTGLDSITMAGMPGCNLELEVKYDNVNPFCMYRYLCGSWPKPPVEDDKGALNKPITDDESSRLKEVFSKYDKDASGAIDVKELKGMILELGGTITDEEVEEAMKELDKNNDGTCSFEEFKTFWSSKSGLGGHNSVMLKFLKMKLKAGSFAAKGRSALSNAGGMVSMTDGLADTVISFITEGTPGMEEMKEEKMSITGDLDVEDVKKDGPAKATLVLSCKSESDAGEALAQITELYESAFKEMLEGMVGCGPTFSTEGAKLKICMEAPQEMLDMMVYSNEDMMKVLTPAIKAMRNSGFKVSFANVFADFLAAPDTPFPELWGGAKWSFRACASSFGKNMMFTLLQKLAPEKAEAAMMIEVAKLFTGAEMATALGWHKGNIKDLLVMLPGEGSCASPAGLREMMSMLGPGPDDVPGEAVPVGTVGVTVSKKLEGIDSLIIENMFLPKEFSQNGKDATANFSVKCENFKPFPLLCYLSEPSVEKLGLA